MDIGHKGFGSQSVDGRSSNLNDKSFDDERLKNADIGLRIKTYNKAKQDHGSSNSPPRSRISPAAQGAGTSAAGGTERTDAGSGQQFPRLDSAPINKVSAPLAVSERFTTLKPFKKLSVAKADLREADWRPPTPPAGHLAVPPPQPRGIADALYRAVLENKQIGNRPDGTAPKTPPANANAALADLDTLLRLSDIPSTPGSLNAPLDNLRELSKNWRNWGMHKGVNFGSPPPSLPPEAQRVLRYFADNPTLLNAVIHDGADKSGRVTLNAVNNFIGELEKDAAKGDFLPEALGDGPRPPFGLLPGPQAVDPKLVNQLNPTLLNAALLTANWHAWGLHSGINFNDPPADLPPLAKSVIAYFAKNPALLTAMVVENGGKPGDRVTQKAVTSYVFKAQNDTLQAARQITPFLSHLKAPSNDLAYAAVLAANWNTWGLHQGVNFASPPPGLPPLALDTLKYFTEHPTLSNAITGGGGALITQANLRDFIKNTANNANDAQVLEFNDWGGLTLDIDPAAREQLALPLQSAKAIVGNWTNWGLQRGLDLAHPPADLPPEAKAAMAAVTRNPGVLQIIRGSDGNVTQAELKDFIARSTDNLNTGRRLYVDYLNNNQNAPPAAKEINRQLAILMANLTMIEGADPKGTKDGMTLDGLKAIASNPAVYGSELSQAAALFSNPGLFKLLDGFSSNPVLNKQDGKFNQKDIEVWFANAAPKSDDELQTILSYASNVTAVDGVDTSTFGVDVFDHPEKYTGQQKAAVLIQLQDCYQKVSAAGRQKLWGDLFGGGLDDKGNPISEERKGNTVETNLLTRIKQLSVDPDVGAFLETSGRTALQTMVASSPGLKSKLMDQYKAFESGDSLKADFNHKNSSGALDIPIADALRNFMKQGTFLQNALGTGGQPLAVDFNAIARKTGDFNRIEGAYYLSIVSGSQLQYDLKTGMDLGEAIKKYVGDASAFAAVLPQDVIQKTMLKVQENIADAASGYLEGNVTGDILKKNYGDANGNLDVAKVTALVQSAMEKNPDAFLDENGERVTADKIVGALSTIWGGLIVNGAGVIGDLQDLKFSAVGNKTIQDAFGKGVLHGVGAIVNGVVLAAKSGEGYADDPTLIVSGLSSAIAIAGGTIRAGARYARKTPDFNVKQLTDDQLRGLDKLGQSLGGAAGLLAGSLSLVSGLKSLADGDKVNGALNVSVGAVTLLASTANVAAGGFGMAASFAAPATATSLRTVSAVLTLVSDTVGIAASLLGLTAVLVYATIEGLKTQKYEKQVHDGIWNTLNQYGITPDKVIENPNKSA